MAQVYTFTDSNGEVRLMAEINPAPGGSQPLLLTPVSVAFSTPGITVSPGVTLATIPAGALYVGAYVTVQTSWDADPDAAQLQLIAAATWELGAWSVAANWSAVGPALSTPQILGSINAPTAGVMLADQTRMYRDVAPWTLSVVAAQTAGATMGAATITPIVIPA